MELKEENLNRRGINKKRLFFLVLHIFSVNDEKQWSNLPSPLKCQTSGKYSQYNCTGKKQRDEQMFLYHRSLGFQAMEGLPWSPRMGTGFLNSAAQISVCLQIPPQPGQSIPEPPPFGCVFCLSSKRLWLMQISPTPLDCQTQISWPKL